MTLYEAEKINLVEWKLVQHVFSLRGVLSIPSVGHWV